MSPTNLLPHRVLPDQAIPAEADGRRWCTCGRRSDHQIHQDVPEPADDWAARAAGERDNE